VTNLDHVRIFCAGSVAWNTWRENNRDIVPDLAGLALEVNKHQKGPFGDGAFNLESAQLQRAVLRFADLSGADLEGADLSGAQLQHVCFNKANLGTANLSDAKLDHADLGAANLKNARLRGVSLHLANLEVADLAGADLTGADLLHALLAEANLRNTNLSSARLDHADFAGADLKGANLRGASLHHAKNLTRAQLKVARKSPSTIPPHFQGSASQTTARKKVDALPPISQEQEARGLGVSRPAFTGAAIAVLIVAGVAWQERSQVTGLASFVAEAGLDPPLRKTSLVSALSALPINLAAREVRDFHRTLAIVSGTFPETLRAFAALPETELRKSTLLPSYPPITEIAPVAAAAPRLATLQAGAIPVLRSEDLIPDEPSILPSAVNVLRPDAGALLITAVRDELRPITKFPKLRVREIAAVPNDAKKELTSGTIPVETSMAAGDPPITLVVSLGQQKLDVYRGTTLVTSSKVSSGMRGYDTKPGVFSILEKRRRHHSNLYSGAPMPWMQRLTRTGTAFHGGVVPGYPASHGCVRLPFSFAPKLFQITSVGDNVVVAHDRVDPKLIEHANLFQPLRTNALTTEPETGTYNYAVFDKVPLRILITRRTQRDRAIAVQNMLSSMGYLTPQNFTGRIGAETLAAIRAFQKANSVPQTGAFTDELTKQVYEVAGELEPPEGHLYVRQNFNRVFDVPVAFSNPDQTLGTHVFATTFDPENTKAEWMVLSVEGDDSAKVLDRIEIPDDIRQRIAERLAPGSTLIIADTSINSAILPEGDDFLVLAKDEPVEVAWRKVSQAKNPPSRLAKQGNVKQATAKKAKAKQGKATATKKVQRSARRYSYDRPQRRRFFWRW
jgi:uncharacterized protein YjbI with pentapeptide repeats/lipoprotein-anchoring transpeptidase ErfK/SrfK/peptidoglycan hydrolase-like protein with peptidoglycan-binding domain